MHHLFGSDRRPNGFGCLPQQHGWCIDDLGVTAAGDSMFKKAGILRTED